MRCETVNICTAEKTGDASSMVRLVMNLLTAHRTGMGSAALLQM